MVVAFHRGVALASIFLQAFMIEDLNFASRVFNQSRLLQGMCNDRDTRPPDTQHLAEIFLRERQMIVFR